MVMNLWRRLIPPPSRQWCRAAVLRPPPPRKWRNLEEDERHEEEKHRERRTTCIKIHTRDFSRTNGNFQIKTGCVWLIDIFIWGKWSLQSFNHLNKRPIISVNPKLTTRESYKKGSYRNRSCRIRLCRTGLLLLFWSRAQFLCKAAENNIKLLYK